MRIVTKIVIAMAIFSIFAISSYAIFLYNSDLVDDQSSPVLEIQKNDNEQSLIVKNINFKTNWNYISTDGTATKPSGSIEVGDMITNCFGEVKVYYSDVLLGKWNFRKLDPEFYEKQFVGEWNDPSESLSFNFLPEQKYKTIIPKDVEDDETMISIEDSIDIKEGTFEVVTTANLNQVKLFNESDTKNIEVFNYDFSNSYNSLHLWNETISFSYIRDIPIIENNTDINRYSGQKVNISGTFSSINKSLGYITSNESDYEVIIIFDNYSEYNSSVYDKKRIEIIGFIYQPNENVTWTKPYIDLVDSIRILDQ